MARRHESLRTTFDESDGVAVQVVAPEPALFLPLADLRSLPEARRREEAMRIAAEEVRSPFDLTRGPLLRLRLARIAERDVAARRQHAPHHQRWLVPGRADPRGGGPL